MYAAGIASEKIDPGTLDLIRVSGGVPRRI
jgi:hypothetical protein